MGATNAAIIRQVYEAFSKSDTAGVFGAFEPDIEWHIPGHSRLSGDYKGHGQIREFFVRLMELCEGTLRVEVHKVLAEGDDVVALLTVHAERNGASAAFPEVHVWRMHNGRAVSFRVYQGDERAEDRFWS
jgi:ketosteroid isomerase-like protein